MRAPSRWQEEADRRNIEAIREISRRPFARWDAYCDPADGPGLAALTLQNMAVDADEGGRWQRRRRAGRRRRWAARGAERAVLEALCTLDATYAVRCIP